MMLAVICCVKFNRKQTGNISDDAHVWREPVSVRIPLVSAFREIMYRQKKKEINILHQYNI